MSTSIKNLKTSWQPDRRQGSYGYLRFVCSRWQGYRLSDDQIRMRSEEYRKLLEGYGERIRRQKPQVVGVEEVPCEDDADLSAKPDASRKEAPAAPERRKSKKRSLFSNPFRIDPEEEWAVLQENPDYDTSGCGRLGDLPRSLIEEYIEKFYPGIASENPQNDWISIDTYLQTFHAGWASRLNRK